MVLEKVFSVFVVDFFEPGVREQELEEEVVLRVGVELVKLAEHLPELGLCLLVAGPLQSTLIPLYYLDVLMEHFLLVTYSRNQSITVVGHEGMVDPVPLPGAVDFFFFKEVHEYLLLLFFGLFVFLGLSFGDFFFLLVDLGLE